MINFNRIFLYSAVMCLLSGTALAQHSDKQAAEDAKRHRAMAVAHESTAKCLESGKKHDLCMKELQVLCKGLAIGKYCGMRHEH